GLVRPSTASAAASARCSRATAPSSAFPGKGPNVAATARQMPIGKAIQVGIVKEGRFFAPAIGLRRLSVLCGRGPVLTLGAMRPRVPAARSTRRTFDEPADQQDRAGGQGRA